MKKSYKRYTIQETNRGFYLSCADEAGNVFPTTHHATERLLASRFLQLLGIGPVAPQIHPESVCIGEIILEENNV